MNRRPVRQLRLPRAARWLLRLAPVPPEARAEAEADLHELFLMRRTERGLFHAHGRLYRDLASLFVHPPRRPAPAGGGKSNVALLRDVSSDLRYAVRLFARQPAILLLAVAGLALGLGIATAAFSIMNAAVVRGEGIVDPGRAPGVLRVTDRSVVTAWGYEEFLRLRQGATRMQVEAVLTDAAAVRLARAGPEGPAAPVAFVSGGFFAATGGRVALGRSLEPGDEAHGGPPPVVVSHVFWTARLGADPAAVGRTIRIGRTDATIVGVAVRGFSVPNHRLLWMPLTAYGAVYDATLVKRTPDMGLQVFGRLLPGVTLSEAEAQLAGVAAALPRGAAGAGAVPGVRLDANTGLGRTPSTDRLAITMVVFAVIALVLLLAWANVASVLVSAAMTREREIGVRAALGASRWRIVRQLVTESLLLGGLAGLIGLLVAAWAVPMIGTMIEAPAGADLAPDLNVYLFLAAVTLATSVAAGLAPALHTRGADLVTPLKGSGARTDRIAPRRLRSMLVVTQAAVSVLLIVMATLFVRATFRAAAIDVGFDAAGLYAVSVGLPRHDGDKGSFWRRAVAELQGVPGVEAVTLAEFAPFEGATKTSLTREAPARVVHLNRTRADYFEALGLRVLEGRIYSREEVAANAPVAVISRSLARAYWPDASPVGQLLPSEIPLPPSMTELRAGATASSTRPVVVGVVADAIGADLHQRNTLAIYEPLDPASEIFAKLIVRVPPGATAAQAGQRLRSIDPMADVRITSIAASLQQEATRPRTLATLTGCVGVVAIVLCVIGLYGLTASVVGQRTREMGVRTAMGASPGDLLRLLMWDSLRPVVLGLALGAGAALLAGRLVIAGMFFGVSPHDPAAFTGAAATLLGAAVLAVMVPTRRAATVDAASVLRQS